ncbi:RRM domain-containing RNA-binding protein [Synechococcus sp. PCC 7502]|uniref:RNA recognition motif domain-containing protein n=1 Tax=Synechococcus sp. PCC 7502 TaxID=1173263 RepID=UPI00029FA678|nr:RNA-binding protein [Synechococcus sp. PCC 7502]AFY75329.1 RRM domain-containing RNA-binding protein [Synechococcus sp. PCC 7502]
MSIRLYVGNLPAELDREGLEKIFSESGDSVSLKIISDTKTGKCRGFGFVTVETPEAATTVIEKFNGYDFNGALLKLEEALPRTKGQSKTIDGSDSSDETSESPKFTPPTPKATKQNSSNSGKSRRSNNTRNSSTSQVSTTEESHQPDPRWAAELEKFKQLLLASQ